MSRLILSPRAFFIASFALLLAVTFAPTRSFAAGAGVGVRPAAPLPCTGTTPPICATITQGGVTYYYYFEP